MSVDSVFTKLKILLCELDYDDTMRWLIDIYTFYMMILFDISHGFMVMDNGRSYKTPMVGPR